MKKNLMSIMYIIVYVLSGLFAGFCAGILGIGGGVIVVPVLYWTFFKQNFSNPMHMAVATSVSVMIFTALSSTISHAIKKSIEWHLFALLSCGVLIGGTVGPFLGKLIPSHILKFSFGGLEIAIGAFLLIYKKSKEGSPEIKNLFVKILTFSGIGIAIGTIATMLGIGGGFLLVPCLIALHYKTRRAVGTSAAFTLSGSIIGSISYFFFSKSSSDSTGLIYLPATISLAIGSLCGAPIGTHFCHKIKPTTLKKIFACFLFVAAITMFL